MKLSQYVKEKKGAQYKSPFFISFNVDNIVLGLKTFSKVNNEKKTTYVTPLNKKMMP